MSGHGAHPDAEGSASPGDRLVTAATGTVMRPSSLAGHARTAGFSGVDVLPVDHDFFRFYRLTV